MSSWGNLDNVVISGNVTTVTTSPVVSGFGGAAFTSNVKDGDYIIIASNKYQVANVTSATELYLTANAATNSANVKAYIQQGPKYVSNIDISENVYTIQRVYGVDRNEIGVPENKARGFTHTGWNHYNTYTTEQGETRYKTEVLVAMSKNFAANVTGTLFAEGTDAADDTVVADYLLYFTTQPVATSNTAGNTATLVAVAVSEPTGDTIAYQWSKKDNATATVFTNLANGGNVSGATSNTLVISNVSNVNGNVFRLTITGTSGADSNTSDAVAVTVV